MAIFLNQTGIYRKRQMWVMMSMLFLVIIIPTVFLLWFASEAVRNERMAVRQRLTDLYRSQLENLQPMLENYWKQKSIDISLKNISIEPSGQFKELIESGTADSVILYNREGEMLYPSKAESPGINLSEFDDKCELPEGVEKNDSEYLSAAEGYFETAIDTRGVEASAVALQKQACCLVKAGRRDEAVKVITGILSSPKYKSVRDKNKRLVVPDTQLYAVHLMTESHGMDYSKVLEKLAARLNDYGRPVMPSFQRLSIMEKLKPLNSDIRFPSYTAETLASDYIKTQAALPRPDVLSKVPGKNLWQMVSSDQTAVLLFRHERVLSETRAFIDSNVLYAGARIDIIPRNSRITTEPYFRISAGDYLPDWQLTASIEDSDFDMAASDNQVSMYIWAALLVIIGILILSFLTARLFHRQMGLTRLKNDLITTVSHELKTPLSSIRLLVDTLLDGKYEDKDLVRNYIELIAKENERLSRLVENFLTFSRIEDKRQTFDFKKVEPEAVVESACSAIRHRFESGGFSFSKTVRGKMPTITADHDALTMVLLNLLDNAYQYSDGVKSVDLTAYHEDGTVLFEVRDKGIGLSQDERKKILEPFYQIDQSLSRKGSGFGLGLSIVKSILDVHNGSIEIESEKGKGSVFTVKVPVT